VACPIGKSPVSTTDCRMHDGQPKQGHDDQQNQQRPVDGGKDAQALLSNSSHSTLLSCKRRGGCVGVCTNGLGPSSSSKGSGGRSSNAIIASGDSPSMPSMPSSPGSIVTPR